MAEFRGTERYERLRRLGSGGMGTVYEVFDRGRGERVALKTLNHVSPAGIYDLKREFRSLAGVSHPNVVRLYDMVNSGDHWFFTMELVEGPSFADHVKSNGAERSPATPETSRGSSPALDVTRDDTRTAPGFDESRLREALAQLVEGVSAIHRAGKLHRDLKPSNVLVGGDGRVVVLDFGLVQSEAASPGIADTSMEDNLVVGTPAYMAPEQAAGQRATAASDWYAVGAMLYRALAGELPFQGSIAEVLLRKQTEDAKAPSETSRPVPPDLDRLTLSLLARDPSRRAGEIEVRRCLGMQAPRRAQAPALRVDSSFVGRVEQLDELEEALERSRRGRPQCVFVGGETGAGKTALIAEFCRRAASRHSALVLGGRCYPEEALPYKAFDALIDELSRWLSRLPESAAAELLPRNRRALTSLFPVLERVPIIEAWDSLADLPKQPAQRRERAFQALKELLGRMSDRGPLVLHLDNLEWGDADSAELLASLCTSPEAPAMLLVGSYRNGEAASDFMTRIGASGPSLADAQRLDLTLPPLSSEETAQLATCWLDGDEELARRIAVQTDGDPLLTRLLCESSLRDAASSTMPSDELRASIETLLARVVNAAQPASRRLLEQIAVAGAPVVLDVAARAANLDPDEKRRAVTELLDYRLIEISRQRGSEAASPSHDRIGQAVLQRLDAPTRARLHARLAKAMQSEPGANPEALADHFHKAGLDADALDYATRAAGRAERALAFERAAALYERANDMCEDDSRRATLLSRLAEARLHLGDPAGAAEALLQASNFADGDAATRLREQAASLKLTDAQIDSLFGSSGARESLFDGVSRDEVQRFLSRGHIIEAQLGELVSPRSEATASVLLVLSGELSVAQGTGDVSIGPGEVLGTLSFLQGSPRLTDVRSSANDTRVLKITRASLDELSEAEPRLALQLTVNLARILCGKLVNVHARAFGS